MVVGTTIKARTMENIRAARPSSLNCFNGIFLKDKCFALGCTNRDISSTTTADIAMKVIAVYIKGRNITESWSIPEAMPKYMKNAAHPTKKPWEVKDIIVSVSSKWIRCNGTPPSNRKALAFACVTNQTITVVRNKKNEINTAFPIPCWIKYTRNTAGSGYCL